MKSKSFWKQFAFELAVVFSLPVSALVGIIAIILLCVNGYVLHLLVGTVVFALLVAICVMVRDAWNNAKKAEGHIRG